MIMRMRATMILCIDGDTRYVDGGKSSFGEERLGYDAWVFDYG